MNFKVEIEYPTTLPIRCFTCNAILSRIDIFDKMWYIYINNINKHIEYINKQLKKNKVSKNKWINIIKDNWWQKIGGIEDINNNIELNFNINDKDWENIGIYNICCRRMIYTHEEHPLFIYGPDEY